MVGGPLPLTIPPFGVGKSIVDHYGFAACFDSLDAFCLRTVEDDMEDFSERLRSMIQRSCLDWDDLPRENDAGCVEYKWRLGREHDSHRRVERFATQMRFRVAEGEGEAFYLLGVCDSGASQGLTSKEHAETASVLMQAAGVTSNMFLLEAMSDRHRGGRRCSAWRVESREAALARLSPAGVLLASKMGAGQRGGKSRCISDLRDYDARCKKNGHQGRLGSQRSRSVEPRS